MSTPKEQYEVYEGGLHIFKGTKEEIERFFEITESQFNYSLCTGNEVKGKKVTNSEKKVKEEPKKKSTRKTTRTSSGVRFN